MKKILFFLMAGLISMNISAQTKKTVKKSPNGYIRCLSTEHEKKIQQKFKRATIGQFETWMSNESLNLRNKGANKVTAVRTIPVVVHVINKGESVGQGTNISDAQVRSQITTLNNDYRKKIGTKGYNTNPVGADTNIEFALAVRDPNGNPTNGIDRVSFDKEFWQESDVENVLKPNTIWEPTKYLNLWVVNFGGDLEGVLGYAQFPVGSTLNGLDDTGLANTDGVIIGYQFFGNLDYNDGSFNLDATYGYGRTATHEIGHWLGLRHIWGDDTCGEDYVADTPVHEDANYGCFTHPKSNDCGTSDEMFENYMDYTNDDCMNIFTQNQLDRFNTVLTNSVRRKELLTSDALTAVTLLPNDGEVSVRPSFSGLCGGRPVGNFKIINRGSNNITSATLSINDNGSTYTQNWSGNLGTNQEAVIPVMFSGNGVITATLTSVNGGADSKPSNNTSSYSYTIKSTPNFTTTTVKLDLKLDIYGTETTWELINANGDVLYHGGPYTDTATPPALKTFTFNLANNDCYSFIIRDLYGDGICCDAGSGYYKLSTSSGTVMINQTSFNGYYDSYTFSLGTLLAAEDVKKGNVEIFPNPVNDVLNITKVSNNATFTIFNVAGQFISKGKVTNNKVNVATLAKGVYFIEVSEKGATSKMKFIKK
ncbi:hypothetical protein C3729_10510 [Cloacibacterium normanense]|uniref:Por secretion system C-terminal sorting domain protein n=1 Tax=Cloacibacterium normanense TaxID=237258 RepID=A0A2S7I2M8_9FLAO|nr:T9SS type A sorting domain-containing protein [Cloacibacterium normanense]PPZ90846.1 hypothetical protein C3729_10510 [Cloacibacterium normanense]